MRSLPFSRRKQLETSSVSGKFASLPPSYVMLAMDRHPSDIRTDGVMLPPVVALKGSSGLSVPTGWRGSTLALFTGPAAWNRGGKGTRSRGRRMQASLSTSRTDLSFKYATVENLSGMPI